MSKFIKQLHARVADAAANNLAAHTIQQLHADGAPGRIWKCSNNGSSVYAFTVYAPPGWLMMTGDMGGCMWSRHRDMLSFIRGAINSLGYFSEKASNDCNIRCKYTELAEEWLSEAPKEWEERHGNPMTDEELEQLPDIRDAYENYGEIHDLPSAVFESPLYNGDCSTVPSCEYYTYHYLWKIEALKWFVERIDSGCFTKLDFTW